MRTIAITLIVTFAMGFARPVDAQTIFTSTTALTNPPMPNNSLNRAWGRKGWNILFYRSTDNASIAIQAPAGSVTFTINGLPKVVQANTDDPMPGQVGYQVLDGWDYDCVTNSLDIVYNGDLANGDVVSFTVNGATSVAGGLPQDHPYTWSYTAGPNLLRAPTSLGLVLDVSGSMNWTIPGGTGTRIDALRAALQVLINTMKANAPSVSPTSCPGDNIYTMQGDRVGVAYFSTTATPRALVNANSDASLTTVSNDIQGFPVGGWTSIGAGLVAARDNVFATSPAGNVKHVLLFSDGEQNTAPNVTFSGTTLQVGGTPYDPTIPQVCPFTLGDMTAPGNTLMSNIAGARCGNVGNNFHILSTPAGGMTTKDQLINYFQTALASVLVGDKLELSRSITGSVSPGGTTTERFLVNAKDVALTLVLTWPEAKNDSLPFDLRAPDGTLIDMYRRTIRGRGSSVTTVQLPVLKNGVPVPHAGEWQIMLKGSPRGTTALPYRLLVMLDNELIASTFDAVGTDIGTGEPIPLHVTLREAVGPVLGASVAAQVLGPKDGIGNILSEQPTPAGSPSLNGDSLRSAAQAKLQLLLDSPATAALFGSQNLPVTTLYDDGQASHGDATANDGVYSAIFRGASDEGYYNFMFAVVGSAPANGTYHRIRPLSVFVRPKPDSAQTTLTVVSSTTQPGGNVIVVLRAIPRDSFGNYLGPDYLGSLTITSSGGPPVVAPLQDKLNGSYEISYQLPSVSSNPLITLEVMGTRVIAESLSALKPQLPKRVLSLHGGTTIPQGTLSNNYNGSLSFAADFEYRLNQRWSVEAYAGYDRFNSKTAGPDFHVSHVSVDAKATFGVGQFRPAVQLGPGVYFAQGGNTYFGWNGGVSLQYWVRPKFATEVSFNDHNANGGKLRYATLLAGVRLAF